MQMSYTDLSSYHLAGGGYYKLYKKRINCRVAHFVAARSPIRKNFLIITFFGLWCLAAISLALSLPTLFLLLL